MTTTTRASYYPGAQPIRVKVVAERHSGVTVLPRRPGPW